MPPLPPEPVGPSHVCLCCKLRVRPDKLRCEPCESHFFISGEDSARTAARISDHEDRHVRAYNSAWEQVYNFEGRMKSALRSRDTWRAVLVEVMNEHEETEDGTCKCGAKSYPCISATKLEQANRGIARQVESYLAMDPEQMESALYGYLDDDFRTDVA